MLPHWDTAIEPLLAALDAGPIIEIGAATGETTVRLAEFAAERKIVLHSVDPAPQFDVTELKRRFDGSFCFHRERSHDALEQIEAAAAVIIDGDHNWYTVHGELKRIERCATRAGRRFPLVIFHDVEWPYARRDMYYEPDAIPEKWQQPWQRRGIRWGESTLSDDGIGINPRCANAIEEGGPRNGVLTAIEDFIEQAPLSLELRIVRGAFGIGLLAADELLDSLPALRQKWDELNSPDFLLAEAERLSNAAAGQAAKRYEAAMKFKRSGHDAGRYDPLREGRASHLRP